MTLYARIYSFIFPENLRSYWIKPYLLTDVLPWVTIPMPSGNPRFLNTLTLCSNRDTKYPRAMNSSPKEMNICPYILSFSLDKMYLISQISNMPRAKTEPFPETIVALADFAKALAHPARIQIITFLQVHGPCPCMDIVAHIPLSQPSVSRHIAALTGAGLVEENPKGNTIQYALCKDRIQMFCETFSMTLKP